MQKLTVAESILLGRAIPVSLEDLDKYSVVRWRDDLGLPAIEFKWAPHKFHQLTPKQAANVRAALAEKKYPAELMTEHRDAAGDKPYCIYTICSEWDAEWEDPEPLYQTRVLLNFRRYSWSWTREAAGEGGYGLGVDYINGIDGGIPCETVEQVIRETLVRTVAELDAPVAMKYDPGTKILLNDLLEDALAHASGRAARNAMNRIGDADSLVSWGVTVIPRESA